MLRLLLFLLVSHGRPRVSQNGQAVASLVLKVVAFLDDNNDSTIDRGLGLFGRLQVDHRSKPFRERLRLYGRLDREDKERTILV